MAQTKRSALGTHAPTAEDAEQTPSSTGCCGEPAPGCEPNGTLEANAFKASMCIPDLQWRKISDFCPQDNAETLKRTKTLDRGPATLPGNAVDATKLAQTTHPIAQGPGMYCGLSMMGLTIVPDAGSRKATSVCHAVPLFSQRQRAQFLTNFWWSCLARSAEGAIGMHLARVGVVVRDSLVRGVAGGREHDLGMETPTPGCAPDLPSAGQDN